tara:strand:- start:23592 stop:24050 length:459 start_codon:yes stop_codon:yes gene_type:complete
VRFYVLLLTFLCIPLASCVEQNATTPLETSLTPAIPHPAIAGGMSYEYLLATIVPTSSRTKLDPDMRALWERGAYLYLNPNGTLGHNWSKPGPYAYIAGQTWRIENQKLVISFDKKTTYTFDVSEYSLPMNASTDHSKMFQMTAFTKDKGER